MGLSRLDESAAKTAMPSAGALGPTGPSGRGHRPQARRAGPARTVLGMLPVGPQHLPVHMQSKARF